MVDVAGDAASRYFVQSYESVRGRIEDTYGKAWFDDWPELLKFCYLVRNALSHDGAWGLSSKQYQTATFEWKRASLRIRMRNERGDIVDEGKNVLEYLNGADCAILLLELNDVLL